MAAFACTVVNVEGQALVEDGAVEDEVVELGDVGGRLDVAAGEVGDTGVFGGLLTTALAEETGGDEVVEDDMTVDDEVGVWLCTPVLLVHAANASAVMSVPALATTVRRYVTAAPLSGRTVD